MSQAAQLHHLAAVLEGVAGQGQGTNRDRIARVEDRIASSAELSDAWRSPRSEDLQQLIATLLVRCLTTGPEFTQGYGALQELAQEARQIANELELAAGNEMSWSEQVDTLFRALHSGAYDVAAEMDLGARERAQQEYDDARRRHHAAKAERQDLEARWADRCAAATSTVAAAVRMLEAGDLRVPEGLAGRQLDPRYTRDTAQLGWSRYAQEALRQASPGEREVLWNTLDSTERRVLIEWMPGLVHNQLWDLLSARERRYAATTHRFQTSSGSLSYDWRLGVPAKVLRVGVGGGVEAERADFSDGSVELRLEAEGFIEAGVSADAVEGFFGVTAGGWKTLRFDDIDEHDAFVAELTEAIEADLDGLRPDGWDLLFGPAGYLVRRRPSEGETNQVIQGAEVVSAGGDVATYGRFKSEIPNVAAAAGKVERGVYHDTVTGELGVFIAGSVTGSARSGYAGAGSSTEVEGKLYRTQDGRYFLNLHSTGDLFARLGTMEGAPLEARVDAGTRTESTLTVEVRPDTADHVSDLLAGIADGSATQASGAIAALEDASHLTSTVYLTGEERAEVDVGSDTNVRFTGATSAEQTQTLEHREKHPYDQWFAR